MVTRGNLYLFPDIVGGLLHLPPPGEGEGRGEGDPPKRSVGF
jgi:hypothetical protein